MVRCGTFPLTARHSTSMQLPQYEGLKFAENIRSYRHYSQVFIYYLKKATLPFYNNKSLKSHRLDRWAKIANKIKSNGQYQLDFWYDLLGTNYKELLIETFLQNKFGMKLPKRIFCNKNTAIFYWRCCQKSIL